MRSAATAAAFTLRARFTSGWTPVERDRLAPKERRMAPMVEPRSAEGCPDPNVVVALLEQRLDDEARARIDAHVDRCPECRELIAAMSEDNGRTAEPTNL